MSQPAFQHCSGRAGRGRAIRNMARRYYFFCLQPMRDVAGSETQALLRRRSSLPLPQGSLRVPRGWREMWEALEIETDVVRRWWELLHPAHLLNVSHGELGWAVFQSFTAKPPKTNSWKKKTQKPSSVHLGELAEATKITEDTKELLTRSFCEALWLLTWKSTHNSERPLCAGQGLWQRWLISQRWLG